MQLDALYAVLRAVTEGKVTEADALQRLSRSPHWVGVARDPVPKRLLTIDVGDRTRATAQCVVQQSVQVLAPGGVPLFLPDGFTEYTTALRAQFGQWEQPARRQAKGPWPKPRGMPLPPLLYAQVIKVTPRRRLVRVRHRVVFGALAAIEQGLAAHDWHINTACIARVNRTIRQHVAAGGRRVMTRCKGEDGLRQQRALYHRDDTLCLPHASLRQPVPPPEPTTGRGSATRWQPRTPAMAADLTEHVWTWRDVLVCRVPPWPPLQAVSATDEEDHRQAARARCARRQAKRASSGPGTRMGVLMTGWFTQRGRLRTGASELSARCRYTAHELDNTLKSTYALSISI